ncbi:MAG: hypothetical protein AB1758_17795 [Candidatus Eremiobacterota bacterium]
MRVLLLTFCLFFCWQQPAQAQVVGLVLDPVEEGYCVARSNARPLNQYDMVSIRRGSLELGQARVVRGGTVCMLRLIGQPYLVQRGDSVVFVGAGSRPPAARNAAHGRSLQAEYGPGPTIPPHYFQTATPCSASPKRPASFKGAGGGGG